MDEKLDEIINNLFKTYDFNKNGTLDAKELEKFLNDTYVQAGRKPTNFSEVNDLIKNHDINKDGVIDMKEMKEIIKKKLNFIFETSLFLLMLPTFL